jgi:phage gpG-like protein
MEGTAVIRIAGIADAIARLARLDLAGARADGLHAAASLLRDEVVLSLSYPPGTHPGLPALRSGALRASIGAASTADGAVIASTSPVAVFQELGTARIAPRPFLGPTAAQQADRAAQAVADAIQKRTDP